MDELSRLSLNTATTKRLTLPQAVDAAARAGLGHVGLWRDRVAETGLEESARIVAAAGLSVSSLCRGGFLTALDAEGQQQALEDNRAAIREAAVLGTRELIMVVGGLADGERDIVAARGRVSDRLGELVPYAQEHDVRLVLEPLHPMYAADRAVLSTLGQALDLAESYSAEAVGIVVDTFHVWWDPELEVSMARAGTGNRIASYQICDFNLPIAADALLSRGMMGDGVIDFPAISAAVKQAGYQGVVEVEIFNADVWSQPADHVIATMIERWRRLVLPYL